MTLPEDIQQLLIAYLRRIILNFDRFSMAGAMAAYFLIGRVCLTTASIAYTGIEDSFGAVKNQLDMPKATSSKNSHGSFCRSCH